MRIGFVSLGRLGAPLAANLLQAGFDLVVHDSDPEAASALGSRGAQVAQSAQEVARAVDAVITCLPSPGVVADVVAGSDGILAALRRGGTWIDMSTNDSREVVRLAAIADERGITTLEAPVTGGVHLAATGEITIIIGGDRVVAEAHMPLFRAMGSRIFHVGPLGSASRLKVVTNMLAFVHLVACGEALMLAKRAGLDLGQAFEVIAASSGTSFVHETEGQLILGGSYDIGFTLDLAVKDLELALSLGDEAGVPLALTTLVSGQFAQARERYGGSAWSPTVVKLLEDELGEELRAPGFPVRLG